jgi:hypothetical protein
MNKETTIDCLIRTGHAMVKKNCTSPELLDAYYTWLLRFAYRNNIATIEVLPNNSRLHENIIFNKKSNDDRTLFIATELLKHGGHTPLLRHLVSAKSFSDSVVICRTADKDTGINHLILPHKSSYQRRAEVVTNSILEHRSVVILPHPDDYFLYILIARLPKVIRSKIVFIDHADHIISPFRELGLRRMLVRLPPGISFSDPVLPVDYLGIPIVPLNLKQEKGSNSKVGTKLIMTSGAPYKFAPRSGRNLVPDMITALLAKTKCLSAVAVGPRIQDTWWIKSRVLNLKRLKIVSKVGRKKYKTFLDKADVFLDSYPLTGGTAFTEALLSGKLVAGPKTALVGYGVADLLRVEIEDLQNYCSLLLKGDKIEKENQERIRVLAAAIHEPAAVAARLQSYIKSSGATVREELQSELEYKKQEKYIVPSLTGIPKKDCLSILPMLWRALGSDYLRFALSVQMARRLAKFWR